MLDVRIDDGLRHMDWIERQLAETHRLETEADWAGKVSLNRELYRAVAAAGNLLFAGAFVDGELVGYCSAFLSRHPHYDCLMCQHDALFLLPEYRVRTEQLNAVYVDRAFLSAKVRSFIDFLNEKISAEGQ